MLGAIIGDIAGSVYEFDPEKSKDFPLFTPGCRPTDDSIMTIAVGCACVDADITDEWDFKEALVTYMKELGRMYPDAGYGGRFYHWLQSEDREPYGSYANGSCMRVSPVGWAGDSLADVERLAKWSAEVTHDHPDAIRGAQAVAGAIYLARDGETKEGIRDYITEKYYDLDFTLKEIRPSYRFDVSCEGSVPQAIMAFLESEDYEDAIRNAISLGGDSDTQAAIAGAIAEAYYGVPDSIQEEGISYLDEDLQGYFAHYSDILYRGY